MTQRKAKRKPRGDELTERTFAAVQPGEVLTVAQAEQRAINNALNETNGNKARAAKLLGITRRTLYNKLQQYAAAN